MNESIVGGEILMRGIANFKNQSDPFAVSMMEQIPGLLYDLIFEQRQVEDWKKVVPLVQKFYEHFTGESMPNLDDIVSVWTEEEMRKRKEEREYSNGAYIIPTKTVRIEPKTFSGTASTLFHELLHRLYDGDERLILEPFLRKDDSSLDKSERKIVKKEYFRQLFLHECVSHAGAAFFENIFFPNMHDGELGMYTPSQASKALNDISSAEKELGSEEYGMTYIRGSELGRYVARKYQKDPQLWDKLKQLRTLDDLRRLVNES